MNIRQLFNFLVEEAKYPLSFEFKIQDKNNNQRWLKGNFFKDTEFGEFEVENFFWILCRHFRGEIS